MKHLLSIVTILGLTAVAHANKIGPAGCGLGNLAFGKDNQILAATTNGTSGNQTFGITSGTSNCVDSKGMAKLDAYVEANQVALANDVARGNGETVAGLSKILGCTNGHSVNSTLQQNYEMIFPTQDRSASEVSKNIREVLKSNNIQCSHLG